MNNSFHTFSLSQEGLFLLEKSRKTRICNFIQIKSVIIDKDTDIETYKLEYRRRNTNELNTRIIKSEDIQ